MENAHRTMTGRSNRMQSFPEQEPISENLTPKSHGGQAQFLFGKDFRADNRNACPIGRAIKVRHMQN